MTGTDEPDDDELVEFARIVKEVGWPAYKVSLALGRVGDRLHVVQRRTSGQGPRPKLYPLRHTLALLRKSGDAEQGPPIPADATDERVPFERLVEELGWSSNTVRRYMSGVRHLLVVFPGKGDRRKKLYPLHQTTRLLRREYARIEARRQRANDDAAGYWMALASLRVAAGRLLRLSRDLTSVASEVRKAYKGMRDRPPRSDVEISTLPDADLALVRPLRVMVAPLRLTYWKASVPEITRIRSEGRSAEEAVLHLRERLVAVFRDLQRDPDRDRQLWNLLNEFIRVREQPT